VVRKVSRESLAGALEVGADGVEDADDHDTISSLVAHLNASGADSWRIAIVGSVVVLVED
jgi:hypothetical protein